MDYKAIEATKNLYAPGMNKPVVTLDLIVGRAYNYIIIAICIDIAGITD